MNRISLSSCPTYSQPQAPRPTSQYMVRGPLVHKEKLLTLVSEDDDDDANSEREGWETVTVDGRTMGIKTSALEEKCQAFETLLIYCSTLGGKYAPYLSQTLEICIPCLKFDFHEGVREASAMYVFHTFI